MTDDDFDWDAKGDPSDDYEELVDKGRFLRWFHLKRDALVTIETIERGVEVKVRDKRTGAVRSEKKPVIHFKGKKMPLIMNKTNLESIADIHGRKPSLWLGKQIVLFHTLCRAFGKQVDCIRIKAHTIRPSDAGSDADNS